MKKQNKNRRTVVEVFLITLGITLISFSILGARLENKLKQFEEKKKQRNMSSYSNEGLWSLINNYRKENGKAVLKVDSGLCEYANLRAREIVTDWSHDGFFQVRHQQYCSSCSYIGENLAREFSTPQEIFNGWLGSPGHKENLDRPFNIGCLGFYYNGYNVYVVLELGQK